MSNTSDTTASKKGKDSQDTNDSHSGSDFNVDTNLMQVRKAADSVLKWGGGHAKEKKVARQKKKDTQQMRRRVCRFGSECFRKDCYFMHPERNATKSLKKEEVS